MVAPSAVESKSSHWRAILYNYYILIFYVKCLLYTNLLTNISSKYIYIQQKKSITCSSIAKVALYKQMIMPIIQLAAAAAAVDMCDMVN